MTTGHHTAGLITKSPLCGIKVRVLEVAAVGTSPKHTPVPLEWLSQLPYFRLKQTALHNLSVIGSWGKGGREGGCRRPHTPVSTPSAAALRNAPTTKSKLMLLRYELVHPLPFLWRLSWRLRFGSICVCGRARSRAEHRLCPVLADVGVRHWRKKTRWTPLLRAQGRGGGRGHPSASVSRRSRARLRLLFFSPKEACRPHVS
ncbi:hypothetical protein AAFF_G00422910 [Aldrovandia affinis]|uniref:Uncharacterized protein n=1 Tax=Aldrovandia affinis TaxID=143900 RepID=A0AAD7T825_9TELE|nr:hypothetical protein AAFF_G00422910 [Aldrovandia affinis]